MSATHDDRPEWQRHVGDEFLERHGIDGGKAPRKPQDRSKPVKWSETLRRTLEGLRRAPTEPATKPEETKAPAAIAPELPATSSGVASPPTFVGPEDAAKIASAWKEANKP